MRTSKRIILALVTGALLLAPAASPARSTSTFAARGWQAASATGLVKTETAQMLANAQGMTLYVFAPDKPGKSVCYGACAKAWPPAVVPEGLKVPAALPGIKGRFGVALRTDGTRQLTFDGAPLYTWFKDKKPGDMTGQGVGGVWWAVAVSP